MKVREALAKHSIRINELNDIFKSSLKLEDDISSYGVGVIDGYFQALNNYNILYGKAARKAKNILSPINSIPKTPKHKSIPKKKVKKRKRKSVHAISIPMGGMPGWKRKGKKR